MFDMIHFIHISVETVNNDNGGGGGIMKLDDILENV